MSGMIVGFIESVIKKGDTMKLPIIALAGFMLVFDSSAFAAATERGRQEQHNGRGGNNNSGHYDGRGNQGNDRNDRNDRGGWGEHNGPGRNPGHGGGGYNPRPNPYPNPRPNPTPAPRPIPIPTPRPPVDQIYESAVTFYGVSRRGGGEWVRVQFANPGMLDHFALNIRRAGVFVHEAYAYTVHGRRNYIGSMMTGRTQYGFVRSENLRYMGPIVSIDLRIEAMGGNTDLDVVVRSFNRYANPVPIRF